MVLHPQLTRYGRRNDGRTDDLIEEANVSAETMEHVKSADFETTEETTTEYTTVTETEIETVYETTTTKREEIPCYAVNGDLMPVEWQEYLYTKLTEKGIGYWMPIAMAQAYQESSFDAEQVTNGIDMGLFQYREPYFAEWEDRACVPHGDIFDPYHQIDVYTEMVRQWIESGQTESMVISNHNTGGWGDYSQRYVDEVSRWFDTVIKTN